MYLLGVVLMLIFLLFFLLFGKIYFSIVDEYRGATSQPQNAYGPVRASTAVIEYSWVVPFWVLNADETKRNVMSAVQPS